MILCDMHHAAVAVEELGGQASAYEVAEKLRWTVARGTPHVRGAGGSSLDVKRAETAMHAAVEQGYLEPPRVLCPTPPELEGEGV